MLYYMAQSKKAAQDKELLNNLLQTTLTTAKEIEAPVQMVVPVKPPQPPAEQLKQIIIRVPADQKKKWERYCLDKDVFMQELIIDAVEAKIKQ